MPTYDESLKSITLDADASIGIRTGVPGMAGSADPNSGKQFYYVNITGPHAVGLAAAGGKAIGVLQNKPQSVGEAATVGFSGVSLVMAGGTLTAGEEVGVKADGTAVTWASGAVVGRVIYGASIGQLATVLLRTT
jgi:hypothetical protein